MLAVWRKSVLMQVCLSLDCSYLLNLCVNSIQVRHGAGRRIEARARASTARTTTTTQPGPTAAKTPAQASHCIAALSLQSKLKTSALSTAATPSTQSRT
jgi:hypothetical protein